MCLHIIFLCLYVCPNFLVVIFFFKFRSVYCLIYKVYIALAKNRKKSKTKTVKPRHSSKVWTLPAFQIQELWNLYIPIGRTRQRYEQSHDISLNKLYVTEGSFLGLAHCLYKRKKQNKKTKPEEQNESPVFQINLLHIHINPQCPGKQHAFIFCLILELESWFISAETPQATGKMVALKYSFILLW